MFPHGSAPAFNEVASVHDAIRETLEPRVLDRNTKCRRRRGIPSILARAARSGPAGSPFDASGLLSDGPDRALSALVSPNGRSVADHYARNRCSITYGRTPPAR